MDVWRARCESGCSIVLLVGVICERVFRGDVWVGVVGVGRDLDCGVAIDTRLDMRAGSSTGARVSPRSDGRMSPKPAGEGRLCLSKACK